MWRSALGVLAASFLLAGCDGMTEPRYPPGEDDRPNPNEDEDDETALTTPDRPPAAVPVAFPPVALLV